MGAIRVALLRGVNLGARNKVPMPALRTELEALGLLGVETYVQSGNAVFESRGGREAALATEIEARIAKAFGVDAAVVLRTAAAMEKVVSACPFADTASCHVVFLDRAPKAAAVAKLDPDRSTPDAFEVTGREIYLRLPNGAGRSKLTLDYFERVLGVRGTARNWRTVSALVELTRKRARTDG